MDDYDTEYQILGRITFLHTLDRCKSVCKKWYQIINETSFMPTYCRNTGNMYGYILQTWDYRSTRKYSNTFLSINQNEYNNFIPSNADLKFDNNDVGSSSTLETTDPKLDGDVQILASSMQGILFCVKCPYEAEKQLYVCKPTTGQWRKIPNPKSIREMAGLIILSNKPLCYKIVLISRESRFNYLIEVDNCRKYWLEIYDSRTCMWSERVELRLPTCQSLNFEHGIQVGGFLYFLMDTLVLAFHGDNQDTFPIPLPQSLSSTEDISNSTVFKKLTEYRGNLGFVCVKLTMFRSLQLWILEDHNTPLWNKIKEVDMSFLGRYSTANNPIGFYNTDILVLRQYNGLVLCNFQDFTYKELKLNNLGYVPDIFPFRSDREPVDLADPCGADCLDYILGCFCKICRISKEFLLIIIICLTAISPFLLVMIIVGIVNFLPD